MTPFVHAHATHPDARMALALAAAQIDAQLAHGDGPAPTLGWLYVTDHHAAQAAALLADAQQRWPGVAFVGASGVGVCADGVEYIDEPAIALMLGALPREQFRVFSGVRPLGGFDAAAVQVHADGGMSDLEELLGELSARARSGYLFGGLAAGRTVAAQLADGVFHGGLSGVAFGPGVRIVSRVTQGCQPVGPRRTVTEAERNVVYALDGEPALACVLRDLDVDGDHHAREALPRLRQTMVGLTDPGAALAEGDAARRRAFGADTRVRALIGIDPGRQGIAIGDTVAVGTQLAFCQRHVDAARRDLVRICAEVREEFEAELPFATAAARRDEATEPRAEPARRIAGAVYVSCAARGGPHFGGPNAELAIVRHALGEVPLVGFFAGGEIARHHLYGYTGVLTAFAA